MKSGIISASGSDTALTDAICPASQRQSSLGSVCADILANKSGATRLIVFLAAGIVYAGPSAALSGGTQTASADFTPVALPPALKVLSELRSSLSPSGLTGFTAGSLTDTVAGSVALGSMLKTVLDPQEIDMTFARLVDAMDDAYQALESPPTEVVLLIQQDTEALSVAQYSVAPTVGSATATFTRTAPTSEDAVFGG